MVNAEDAGILKAHVEAVGGRAAGYIFFSRIASCYLDLQEYNGIIRTLSNNKLTSGIKMAELDNVRADLQALISSGGGISEQEEFNRVITALETEVAMLKRLDAAGLDAAKTLGTEYPKIIDALRIRDLSPRHAFRTATRKLEFKAEGEVVNYLIRAVSDEGSTQERHIVKEVKDAHGNTLDYASVARLLYTETADSFGNRTANITPVVVQPDEFVRSACAQVQTAFEREISGASSSRFTTAIKHLTNALQGIPLASRGWVYYCAISKAPVVALTRELVRWVDFRFRKPGGEGCQFLALPLMGTKEVEEEVVQAANAHLQMKLAESIAKIQAVRKERAEIPDDMDPLIKEEKLKELKAQEMLLREEVTVVQQNVTACLEELVQTQGALQLGSKVLLKEYSDLLGI